MKQEQPGERRPPGSLGHARRAGRHYSLKQFNDKLLTYGSIPFKQIRRLMLEG